MALVRRDHVECEIPGGLLYRQNWRNFLCVTRRDQAGLAGFVYDLYHKSIFDMIDECGIS